MLVLSIESKKSTIYSYIRKLIFIFFILLYTLSLGDNIVVGDIEKGERSLL